MIQATAVRIRRFLIIYLVVVGVLFHVSVAGLVLLKPQLVKRIYYKVLSKAPWQPAKPNGPFSSKFLASHGIVPLWKPVATDPMPDGSIKIEGHSYPSLSKASLALHDGQTLDIGPGIYRAAMIIRANDIILRGHGHVILDGKSVGGKAALVIKGNGSRVENIECRNIRVHDRNGACIRLEGKDLTVSNVYFHDSEEGILTGYHPGRIEIQHSRFERLGMGGRAHGIYIGGGELNIHDSLFLQSVNQGHEIKSRAAQTFIERCIIASLDATDSRLIDLPNGGNVLIRDSVLAKGRGSSNSDLIGFGLEGHLHPIQKVELTNNILLLERPAGNVILHMFKGADPPKLSNNIIVGNARDHYSGMNFWFKDRAEAGMAAYPALPKLPGS